MKSMPHHTWGGSGALHPGDHAPDTSLHQWYEDSASIPSTTSKGCYAAQGEGGITLINSHGWKRNNRKTTQNTGYIFKALTRRHSHLVGNVGQPTHEGHHTFFMTFPILDISNLQTYVKRGFPFSHQLQFGPAEHRSSSGWQRRRGVTEESLTPLEAKLDPRKKVGRNWALLEVEKNRNNTHHEATKCCLEMNKWARGGIYLKRCSLISIHQTGNSLSALSLRDHQSWADNAENINKWVLPTGCFFISSVYHSLLCRWEVRCRKPQDKEMKTGNLQFYWKNGGVHFLMRITSKEAGQQTNNIYTSLLDTGRVYISLNTHYYLCSVYVSQLPTPHML